jgi:hypothetical protein
LGGGGGGGRKLRRPKASCSARADSRSPLGRLALAMDVAVLSAGGRGAGAGRTLRLAVLRATGAATPSAPMSPCSTIQPAQAATAAALPQSSFLRVASSISCLPGRRT